MFQKIRAARVAKGMSQEKLAEISGISRSTIIGLENGKITNTKTDTLRSIAKALGLTIDEIFFGEGD